MTDLTEEVARALQGAFPTIGFKKAPLDAAAQAAIAIVLEHLKEPTPEMVKILLQGPIWQGGGWEGHGYRAARAQWEALLKVALSPNRSREG